MKEYKYKINGNEYAIKINKIKDKEALVEVNGQEYNVELIREEKDNPKPIIRPKVSNTKTSSSPQRTTNSSKGGIKAPLPGVILDILVSKGEEVKKGQKLAILEAMKMENMILSDRDGKVQEIKVQKGESILEGNDIIIIA